MLEAPPSVPAPSPNHTFVSGCWVYQGNRYVWRAGYWVPHDPGWIWVPAHYVWTPGGHLFVEGYWDYPLRQRGLLFTPVALDIRLCTRPTFVYQPRYAVHDECLYGALFVRPANRHYYFGDYFEARYQGLGFTAWFDVRFGGAHDPLFGYYRAEQHDRRVWEHEIRELHAARMAGTAPRPPRTLVQQNTIVNNITVNNTTVNNVHVNNVKQVTMVSPVTQVNRPDLKLQPISTSTQLADKVAAQKLTEVSRDRRHLESHLTAPGKPPVIGQRPVRTVARDLPKRAPTGVPSGKAPPPLPTQPLAAGPARESSRRAAADRLGPTPPVALPKPPLTGGPPQPSPLQPQLKASNQVPLTKRPVVPPVDKKRLPPDKKDKDKDTKQ